jgi:Tfp pilus assembly protein PilO
MNAFFLQLRTFARNYPVAFTSLVLLVVLGGADWFLWKRWTQLNVDNERSHAQGEAMLLSLSSHPRIEAQLKEAGKALTYIDQNLALESDLAGNLDYFYQIEKSTSAKLSSLSQLSSQPSTDKESYQAIPFSLRLSGSYPQILAYLHALETGPRLVRLKNYRLSQGGTSEGLSLDLTVDMLGRS